MKREDITNKIVKYLIQKDIIHNFYNVNLDASLSNEYGVDSLGFVDIIIYCEEEFEFEFDYIELDLSNFENINSLVNLIEKRVGLEL
ncbi:MAG TPA: phosphopantetheine-binding protein [Methylomusa anaerophila]|uniref:Acyl carrier protein n=1 Tax=Methylomusa anaerophila TaxID=1930071 RepID=A0A348AES5_9FIRM|nr:phosphopantetheine-binding protein [Methylomusa anaerophila]BBB89573.1 acyl carrier protein [Methylomusa anaerophila]HML89653.1 phosphopantetheine-binding protein [Methylomusa anaerophila]